MKQPLINCISLANSKYLELASDMDCFMEAGVKYYHIDIMDGNYVPNLCHSVRFVSELREKYPDIILDVHLMVMNPADYIQPLADAGASIVSLHVDSTRFVIRCLRSIKEAGMMAGVILNPSQRVDVLSPYIHLVDAVTLMTVEPGYAGQTFMVDALPRVSELSAMRGACGNDFLISIDGGINYPNVQPCVRRGANMFITGIYTVYRQEDGLVAACHRFEQEMAKGLEP